MRSCRYNVEKDFAPVGLMARFPMLLVVNAGVPVKNLAEFVAWAKQQPGGVNYATPGTGSPHHLATELFRERSGLKLAHVPYRGAAPAVQDVIGGQVPFMFVDTASGYPHILSGKLRAIGVASPKRVAGFDTCRPSPSRAEGLRGLCLAGAGGARGTPPDVVAALNKALLAALEHDRRQGALPDPRPRGDPEHAGADGRLFEERAGKVGPGDPRRQHPPRLTWHAGRKNGAATLDRTVTHRLHTLHKLTDRVSQAAYLADAGMPLSEGRCLAAVGAFSPLSVNDLARAPTSTRARPAAPRRRSSTRGWCARRRALSMAAASC